MKAYQLERPGDVSGIILRDRYQRPLGPTEILVRVKAASINRRDLMIVEKTYPLPPKLGVVPLSDGAGEVVATGDRVKRFKVGDRVTGSYWPKWRDGRLTPDLIDQLGCTLDGMGAEYAFLDEQWAVRLPDHLSWEEGACLSCAGVTAWCAVTGSEFAGPGRTVLTLGTGDVSLFAVMFARLMGCRVIATTSSPAKAARLRALGADEVVNYSETPEWGNAVRSLTDGAGVDLVIETMGPPTFAQSLIAAARYSEIVLLIWKAPGHPNLVIPGNVYGPTLASIRRLFVGSRADLEAMIKAIAQHSLSPVIDKQFVFEQLHEAYDYFASRAGFGKIVIRESELRETSR